jgi:tetratricopeptide (TPR) repeat protein
MKSRCLAATVMALVPLAGTAAWGMYVMPETRNVPVARLVNNLERQLAAEPKNEDIHIKLARLYGMAYAVNADEVPAVTLRNGEQETVWFGLEPHLIPYKAEPAPDASRAAASRKYLQKALDHYRKALDLNPASLLARLGYGWALQQADDTPSAVAEYRRVIARAWPKEQSKRFAQLGERFYTQEAAGYLIPLLDPERDAAEIAELRSYISRLQRIPRPITPLAIPLSDGSTERSIIDLDAQVAFDADGAGLRRAWTWITPEAGWLVYDATHAGRITSALQWFGNVTFWLFWSNGYEALAALDDDGNGELSGTELRHLAIWHDADRDGISDPGEVRSLADHGIVSLSCRFTRGDGVLITAKSNAGARFSNGRVRPTYDVILRPSFSVSVPVP